MIKKKVLIWGLTKETLISGMMLNYVSENSEYFYVGSYDRVEANKKKMIRPIEADLTCELCGGILDKNRIELN